MGDFGENSNFLMGGLNRDFLGTAFDSRDFFGVAFDSGFLCFSKKINCQQWVGAQTFSS